MPFERRFQLRRQRDPSQSAGHRHGRFQLAGKALDRQARGLGPRRRRGGQIARNLDRIYTHLVFRLQRINLTNDPAICDEVIARLDELRSAWAELAAGAAPPASGSRAEPAAWHATA